MQTVKTPEQTLYIHRGAPRKLLLYIRDDSTGLLIAFSASVVMRVTHPTGTFDLTVGSGITRATFEGIANAEAEIEMSIAQSELIPAGRFSRYEVQDIEAGDEVVRLMGAMIGIGGDNPNA